MTRRELFAGGAAAIALRAAAQDASADPTRFQIGCMTLPYAAFPMERALTGIARAGYRFVGWGSNHLKMPPLAADAAPSDAKQLASRCRDLGLEPVMMFAGIYIEAPGALETYKRRIEQASAAGIRFLISFGHTSPGAYDVWVRN